MQQSRKTETGLTWLVPTRIGNRCSRWRHRLAVDRGTSVFAVFTRTRLEHIHLATSSMHVDMLLWSCSVADGRQSLWTWLRQYTDWGGDHGPLQAVASQQCKLQYNKSRICLRTDAWGTPHRISAGIEADSKKRNPLVYTFAGIVRYNSAARLVKEVRRHWRRGCCIEEALQIQLFALGSARSSAVLLFAFPSCPFSFSSLPPHSPSLPVSSHSLSVARWRSG